jgi:diguanylate cyclase (GGDEF)-like protein
MRDETSLSDAPPAVYVFERVAAAEPLLGVLRQSNYTPIMAIDAGAPKAAQQNIVAALISDQIERPFEVCASLQGGIPKILLTSDFSFGCRLSAARAGVTAVLQRPLQPVELIDWLKMFVAEQTPRAASILIVDDDPVMAAVHAAILGSDGMKVEVIHRAADALTAMEVIRPDLVLMDVRMPEVDGIELARMMRQTRQHLAVPIVFLSGEDDADRQLEARRFGGDIFIKKPVNPKQFASLVRLRADRAKTMRSMIERDSLTGLYNHGQFKERLIQEFDRSRRTRSDLSFAMIDIDHFKAVNDSHGHPVGDRVIRGLANLLTSRLRRTDVVGRYGGEEFGVLLLDTGPPAAAAVIDTVRQIVAEVVFEAPNCSFKVSFSAGIAGALDSRTPEDFVAAADQALYIAKRAGRNRVQLAQSETAPQLAPL